MEEMTQLWALNLSHLFAILEKRPWGLLESIVFREVSKKEGVLIVPAHLLCVSFLAKYFAYF